MRRRWRNLLRRCNPRVCHRYLGLPCDMGHDHRPQQGLHHESLSSQLISAFSTIDVDEVYALSAAENVSQYKYAIAVRDPRIHLPDWLAKSARVAALGKNIMLTDLQAWKPETTFDMMSNSQLFCDFWRKRYRDVDVSRLVAQRRIQSRDGH